jgi:hypothetical protein
MFFGIDVLEGILVHLMMFHRWWTNFFTNLPASKPLL